MSVVYMLAYTYPILNRQDLTCAFTALCKVLKLTAACGIQQVKKYAMHIGYMF